VASGYEELQQLVEKMEKQIRTSEKVSTKKKLLLSSVTYLTSSLLVFAI